MYNGKADYQERGHEGAEVRLQRGIVLIALLQVLYVKTYQIVCFKYVQFLHAN